MIKGFKVPTISEARFQAQVVQIARTFGWLVHHSRPSINLSGKWSTAIQGVPGFVDLVLVHENTGDILFVELKSDKGQLSEAQVRWAEALEKMPPPLTCRRERYHVWRPKDFDQVRARLMAHHRGPRRGDDQPQARQEPVE